ncbi:hypothetical protein MXB_2374 [Myxobolus squamalis]|nr:hypothetical protein MXB_2374 [Myxobolus squamalis]
MDIISLIHEFEKEINQNTQLDPIIKYLKIFTKSKCDDTDKNDLKFLFGTTVFAQTKYFLLYNEYIPPNISDFVAFIYGADYSFYITSVDYFFDVISSLHKWHKVLLEFMEAYDSFDSSLTKTEADIFISDLKNTENFYALSSQLTDRKILHLKLCHHLVLNQSMSRLRTLSVIEIC